jgi:hypothetical protein
VTTTASTLVCGYCGKPAGSPVARLVPGDKSSPLVGVTHDADGCWDRFLSEALALDVLKAQAGL